MPELRRWPRSSRIGRNRLIIDQPGLKVLLLLAQPAAATEGTQLAAECPGGRTRTGQPHVSRVSPRTARRTDGTDHQTSARFLRRKQPAAVANRPKKSRCFFPALLYARLLTRSQRTTEGNLGKTLHFFRRRAARDTNTARLRQPEESSEKTGKLCRQTGRR